MLSCCRYNYTNLRGFRKHTNKQKPW